MKIKKVAAILLFCGLGAFGQTVDKSLYYHVYVFLSSENLTKCTGAGTDISGNEDIPANAEFKITKAADNGDLVIQFLTWKVPTSNTKLRNQLITLNSNLVSTNTDASSGETEDKDIFFKLPLAIFTKYCDLKLDKHSFALGVLVLPIKMRFGGKSGDGTQLRDFTFSNDVSIGLSVGYRYIPNRRFSSNFLTGISLTSVGVTPDNTKNAVSTATNLSAITWHLGYLFQIDNFQIGAFTGVDYLAGNVGRKWDYKDEMWFGIGIGYSIFSSKKTSDTQ